MKFKPQKINKQAKMLKLSIFCSKNVRNIVVEKSIYYARNPYNLPCFA